MRADADRLLALAQAISDGQAVDWAETEASTVDPQQRDLMRQLRLLAGVAEVHRPAGDAAPSVGMPTSWGQLSIVERVGFGSFGSVYRARDPRLARDVALKLLHRDAGDDAASLLVEEGRLLARVRHPHVITVYGADRVDGTAGLWMEFVDGRTLEEILRHDGPLGAHEAALIGIDLCGALAAVHAQGMVHRDIKAQNVMRETGGRIVLMDFGAGHESAGPAPRPVGTPAYMAPEVLAGARATSASDLYSLAVLLFRLTTGVYPVKARSPEALLSARSVAERLRLRDVRPDLPAAFVAVVERGLQIDAANRFSSAGEMQAALAATLTPSRPKALRSLRLRFLIAAAAALAAVTFAIAVWPHSSAPARGPASFRSVGVRPLRNIDPREDQKYFAAGLTDVLIAHLGGLGSLRVVALPDTVSGDAVFERFGVEGVLEGSVQREQGRMRLSARVVQAGGTVLWGKVYEGAESEAFALQGRMAMDLARDLNVPVSATESSRLIRKYVVQPQAQESYLRGKYLLDSHTRANLMQARTEFERAVALEPDYAPALASLALTYLALGNVGVLTPAEVVQLAPGPAERADTLDPTLAEGALAVADVRFRLHWDWDGAREAYQRAVALNPSYVEARGQYARFLAAAGRTDEAMREAQDAYQLDPLSIDIHSVVGMVLYYDRRFGAAVAHFESRIQEPSARSHIGVGRAASAAGRHDDAIPALRRAVELSGGDPSVQAELARALAAAGDRAQAREILRELETRRATRTEYIAPQDLAYVYIALEQPDIAFDLLNKAVEEHASRLLWIGVDPRMDGVRTDPRFTQILGRLGIRR